MSARKAILASSVDDSRAAHDTSDSLSTTFDLIERIEELRPEQASKLVVFISRSAARQRRLDRRDALLRQFAAERYPEPTGRAAAIIAALERFRTGAYAHSDRGDSPEQADMRAILDANKGQVPGKRQVQLILAGHRTPPAK